MVKRNGDRRGRGRFEVVGTLTGTLETWERLGVRNLGAGGALAETATPFSPGTRIGGRLFFRGHGCEVRGEVRHGTPVRDPDTDARYLVGIEWPGMSAQFDGLLTMEPMKAFRTSQSDSAERRRSARFACAGEAEIGHPTWSTVEVLDISTSGVLLASPMPVEVAERGELRLRLGARNFSAQIEVRRGDAGHHPGARYRLGGSFVSISQGDRLSLEEFIGSSRH